MKVTLRRKTKTGAASTEVKLVRRPRVEINAAQVELLASRGLTQAQICDALGFCHQTLITRKKDDLELVEAIKRGKAKGIQAVTNALFKEAMKGNVAAAIFWLKNNAGWRDKIDIEMEYALPAPLVIEIPCIDVTPEQTPELGGKGSQS